MSELTTEIYELENNIKGISREIDAINVVIDVWGQHRNAEQTPCTPTDLKAIEWLYMIRSNWYDYNDEQHKILNSLKSELKRERQKNDG